MKKSYHSSFVIDVSLNTDERKAVMTDSAGRRFIVDLTAETVKSQFKEWFKNVFTPGKPGVATVFEYEQRGNPADMEMHVLKFLNLPETDIPTVEGAI